MKDQFPLLPDSASSVSGEVDALFLFLVAISAFFVFLIVAGILIFSIRYRRQPGRRAEEIEGSTALEILWTAIPLVISLFVFGWATKIFLEIQTRPSEGMQFFVTGKQWMWKLQHPTGQREINALHVPVGETIVLTMTSEDVIHSFYVPAFRVKQDVLPGRYSTLWFEATRVGTYHLFCAEYCGTKHSQMIGQVIVQEPSEYEAWLGGQPAAANPIEAGKVLFENLRCDTCHAAGAEQRGPRLEGLFGTRVKLADGAEALFDEGYVRESLLDPNRRLTLGFTPLMPTYQGQVSEDQILQLVAYLKSLAPEAPAEAAR